MKKILFGFIAIASLYGCGTKGYKVTGTVNDNEMNGAKIYLAEIDGQNLVKLDSATIQNGRFTMNGVADSIRFIYMLLEKDGEVQMARPYLYENANMTVDITPEKSIIVKGTKENNLLSEYYTGIEDFETQMMAIREKLSENAELPESEVEALKGQYDELDKKQDDYNLGFVKANINTLTGTHIFKSSYYGMSLEDRDNIISMMNNEMKKDKKIAKIINAVEAEKRVAIGNQYADITLSGVDGTAISLSEYVGKTDYTLVDFWASWCGPCIMSFPELTKTYEKHKNGRLQIFGISLDDDGEAWKKAIGTHKLSWIHVSDLKGWESAAAQLYAVNFIPTTILIDKTGTIVGRNLSKEELVKILEKN
ncbi:MAG: AhpC/TSA family protein [Prevotellaceae bacterium]|jgi:peroxiredoxin|nr:AhpC/TSA family protein [Prevotellaceae bacterium]